MREVNGDLALLVGGSVFIITTVIIITSDDLADPKFACDAEGEAPDYGAWAEICELIGMVPYAFGAAGIAIYECGVRDPCVWALVFQFLSLGVEISDTGFYLCVDSFLHFGFNFLHLGRDLTYITQVRSIIEVFCPLSLSFFQTIHVECGAVGGADDVVE